jgi:inosine-uridine nucleoside N-ribohydrolase
VRVVGAGAVVGNVPAEAALHNLRRLLALEGSAGLPVGRGAARPLIQDLAWLGEFQAAYGPTEPWPAPARPLPSAAALLIELAHAHPGTLTVLALGPLTNLALAARLAPEIVPLVREVVAMGGALGEAPVVEFNAHCDPEAAAIVLSAGWPVRLLGLDITRQVHFARADFAALPQARPATRLLQHQAPGWIDRVETHGWDTGGCALHDAVAAAVLVDETIATFASASVSVELADPARRGLVRAHGPGSSPVRVAAAVDAAQCHALILEHLAH